MVAFCCGKWNVQETQIVMHPFLTACCELYASTSTRIILAMASKSINTWTQALENGSKYVISLILVNDAKEWIVMSLAHILPKSGSTK